MSKINPEMIKSNLKIIISLIIPALIYSTILRINLPENIGSSAISGVSWLLIIFFCLIYVSYKIPGDLGRALSLSSTLALFALPLAHLWSTGTSLYVIGGLLPWSDSLIYYSHAGNLLQGLSMLPSVHQARPLFVGILSVILWLTQQNLQMTMGILTALIAISCFFVAREIQKSYGTFAATIVVVCLFIFIRPWIGNPMTEMLGLCLGVLSFALLLRGARQMAMTTTLIGLFILTVALNARTGTFLVLPTLLIWGCYVFRYSKSFSIRFLMGGTSVILLGFILNSLLEKAIRDPQSSSSYGNFSFMFYGVITDSRWTQIFEDYPEINTLPPKELGKRAFEIVVQTFINHPLTSLQGIIAQWQKFFFSEKVSIFFTYRNELELILRFLSAIGIMGCLFNFKKPMSSLILMYALGVVASVPFAPILVQSTNGLRVYAATVIIFPVMSALGMVLIRQKIILPILESQLNLERLRNFFASILNSPIKVKHTSKSSLSWQDNILPMLSIALVILIVIGPITIKQLSHKPDTSNLFCNSNLEARFYLYNRGASINLVADDEILNTHLPNIRISDFRKGLKNLPDWFNEGKAVLTELPSGLTILNSYDYSWLVVKSNLIPQQQGFLLACGRQTTAGDLSLFYADYVQIIASKKLQ